MRYWWVNQNQTYRHEIRGGYLWSPKRKRNGARNAFYEFMREVSPGDFVFSFADTYVRAFGLARSFAYEAPQPTEFGAAGRNWASIGWRVDVQFHEVPSPFRPKDRIERLRPLLPPRHSPLLHNGNGVQSIYLTEVPAALARVLADFLGSEVGALVRVDDVVGGHARFDVNAERPDAEPRPELVLWEEHLRREIEGDSAIPQTEKEALVLARRGQGLFRERVSQVERRCRVTGVDRAEHLRASHCKPWRDCSNAERLDRSNGLMLTPSVDHLFDRGFISFETGGKLLVSPVAHRPSLQRMGVVVDRPLDVGRFTTEQGRFLEYHRDAVFLKARVTA